MKKRWAFESVKKYLSMKLSTIRKKIQKYEIIYDLLLEIAESNL